MRDSPREVLAHGENWLEALREGRRQLGEDAGLPPGASCVMAPNGEVTLLDGAQRRRYVLTPLSAQADASAQAGLKSDRSQPSNAEPNSTASDAEPNSTAPNSAASSTAPNSAASSTAPNSAALPSRALSRPSHANPIQTSPAQSSATQGGATDSPARTNGLPAQAAPKPMEAAALAVSPTLPAPPAAPRPLPSAANAAAAAPSPSAVVAPSSSPIGRAKQTVEFSPERAQALQREFEAARARAISAPEPASPAEAPKLPHPNLRAVTASNVRPSSLPPPSVSVSSSLPPPAAALRSVASRTASGEQRKARPLGGSLYGVRDDGLSLLHARDLDPTDESPLTYRERAYLISGKADRVRLEVLLQAELACIRRELSGFPRGQFVRLGLFAEPFEGAPSSPPVATLEWKDWRGRAQFQLASEPSEAQATTPPPSHGASSTEPASASLPVPALAAQRSASRLSQPAESPAPAISSTELPSNGVLAAARLDDVFDDLDGRQSEPDLRLAAAFEAMSELYLLPTPVAGLEFTIQLLSRLVPSEAMSCCLYDINTDEFRFVALSGLGALDRKASAIPAGAGLFGAARRHVLVVPDVRQDTRYRAAVDGRNAIEIRNLAYVPLRYNNQLLGIVQLINRSGSEGFASADVSVLSYVAEQLGEFLANCRALIG